MRRADDISDDPSIPAGQRREKLAAWIEGIAPRHRRRAHRRSRASWRWPTRRRPSTSRSTGWKSWCRAPRWTCRVRPTIAAPAVACITKPSTSFTTTATTSPRSSDWSAFASLAIAIPSAEKLAEQTGVAFQLTNIIRDVKEDSQLGRVYLPDEDLRRFNVEAKALTNGDAANVFRPVLEFEAQRARELYRAADELLPLIDDDSQPALWTLVQIYHRLARSHRRAQLRRLHREGDGSAPRRRSASWRKDFSDG